MNKKLLLLIGFVLVGWLTATAQKATITGKVIAADDASALPGVSVVEKGSTNGTTTDENGNFKINVANNATLLFSFLGYVTQEVPIANQSVLDISLQVDITTLSEIVVVGYGQQDKKDVTGSVAAVTTKDFNKGIISSPQDMLIGKVAGVQISTNDGSPGSNSTIRIRGTGSIGASQDPLIVIDGFPVDNGSAGPNGASTNTPGLSNPLATLNPNDIESYTVLKDASATAVYGMRASNGVILITTKKGKEGKPQISYNGNVSISSPMKYYKVLNGPEMRALGDTLLLHNTVPGLTSAALQKLGSSNTDWQKEIYRNAVSHDHNLSLSGTKGNLPYRISYGYTDQEGILKTTNFVRNSLNINLTPTFFDGDLKVTASMKGSYTQQNFGNTLAQGAAVSFDPTQPVYNGSTRWGNYFAWVGPPSVTTLDPNGQPIPLATSNPVSLLLQTDNRSSAYRGLGNIQLDYRLRFLPALKLTANAGIDYTTSSGHNNAPLNSAWTYSNGGGQKIDYTAVNKSQLLDLYANYLEHVGRSKFDLTAGYSYQSFERDGTNFSRNGQTQDNLITYTDYQYAADGVTRVPHVNPSNPNVLLSFFGRFNYSFDNRYLITITARDDASSRFAPQNRWKIFPSAAVGWNISKESFMETSKIFTDLKLRASYGLTGQQDIPGGAYPYLATYQKSVPTSFYQFGNPANASNFYQTARPQAYDPNIKWETTAQTDIGLDFGVLNNRISGTVDVYQRNTNDLINTIPIAAGTNFSNVLTTNVGSLVNKGIEVTLRAVLAKTEDFEWNLGFNFTHNENKITKLLRDNDPNYAGVPVGGIGLQKYIQNIQVGYPINSFMVYQQVYNTQGKPVEGLYVDRSGDGGTVTANEKNKYRFHKPNADYVIGINSRFNYKKWDFYFSGRLSVGNYIYNSVQAGSANYSNFYYTTGFFNNLPEGVNDTKFASNQAFSDYYVQNASFFKMDNMNLGYNIDKFFTQKLKARVSLTAQNAFFITKYKGIDPESTSGLDNIQYPRPRTFMLGLNITY